MFWGRLTAVLAVALTSALANPQPSNISSSLDSLRSIELRNVSSSCNCGTVNTRIVGGEPSGGNGHPWLVGLVNPDMNRPFCGGTIFNNGFIVTAASCVHGKKESNVDVLLGLNNWFTQDPSPVRKTVSEIIVHPDYNRPRGDNDIAVLKLSSFIEFSPTICPITFPPSGNFEGLNGVVTGWGKLAQDNLSPREAYKVEVNIKLPMICEFFSQPGTITRNMICAGAEYFAKDVCKGDNGGPLTVDSDGQNILVGIVSGPGCAQAPYYSVYTKVSNYFVFINNIAGGQC